MKYRTVKTTMGRKFRVPMTEDEISERSLFRMAITVLPFLGTVLLTIIWLVRG